MPRTCFYTVIILCLLLFGNYGDARAQTTKLLTGNIYGRVTDEANQKPIQGASIQLFTGEWLLAASTHKILITLLSDKRGEFNVEELNSGEKISIRITAIGYLPYEQVVMPGFANTASSSQANNLVKDLGNIRLTRDTTRLGDITVRSARSLLELGSDRKIYHVEKDLYATGGTALDLIRNVPSISVDVEGNITLRNAAPQIFIDGQPTTLSADQVPSDQVASVEIISNPSAKFDAGGGGAGIINIVLKKNRRKGYNGSLRASIDSRAQPGSGAEINVRKDKVNFFASAQGSFRKSFGYNNSTRTDFLPMDTANYVQRSSPKNTGHYGFGRIGIDYMMDNRNTISLTGNLFTGHFKVKDLMYIYRDTMHRYFKETAERTVMADARFKNYGSSIAYKHLFAREGRTLTADVNYFYSNNTNTSDYDNTLFDANGNIKPKPGAQRAEGGTTSNFYIMQADYSDPFSKTQKLELGVRAALRDYDSWNDNSQQNPATLVYTVNPSIGVLYQFKDRLYAAYASYSQQVNKFSYEVGLRVESSEYSGNFITKSQRFSNKYPASLFPSLFANYKINDQQDLQFNYSRKINRPGFYLVIPFVDFSDSINLSVGNPDLRPEFAHVSEIVYSNQYRPGQFLLATVYGRYTDKFITRYQFINSSINPALPARYTTYANARYSYTYGAELTSQNKITKRWSLISNLNLFQTFINARNLPGTDNSRQTSWFAKLNNNIEFPLGFSLQVSGDYQSRSLLPSYNGNRGSIGTAGFTGPLTTAQGYIRPIYGADIAVKKDFGKHDNSSVTVQFSDIFRTRIYDIHSSSADFMQDNRRRRDPQFVRINFSHRFGKFDGALLRRKSNRPEVEGVPGMGM